MQSVRLLSMVIVFGVGMHMVAAEPPQMRRARDVSVKASVPTPRETMSLERIDRLVSHAGSARFAKDRVISPPMTIAVRQMHPDGPTYQEALTYTFLIHSMKFAKLTRMNDGRLILLGTAWFDNTGGEKRGNFILSSDDDGQSWSQPRLVPRISGRARPVNLDGKKLIAIGGNVVRSDDGGETWGEPTPHPLRLSDGKQTWSHGSILVEGDDLWVISYSEGKPHGPADWTAYSWLWRSRDAGRTWETPIALPPEWCTSEGSVTRAKDGALVISLRTAQQPGMPSHCDHWRRITTARSMDDGLTWTDHQVHFRYGKIHSKLLTLPGGDLLMTYAARMGELDDQLYHGIEAVLSRDHGKTWDWDNRFILFRWAMHQSMHTPESVLLSDGRILTIFLYHYDAPWGNGSFGSTVLGITSAVIWSPYPK